MAVSISGLRTESDLTNYHGAVCTVLSNSMVRWNLVNDKSLIEYDDKDIIWCSNVEELYAKLKTQYPTEYGLSFVKKDPHGNASCIVYKEPYIEDDSDLTLSDILTITKKIGKVNIPWHLQDLVFPNYNGSYHGIVVLQGEFILNRSFILEYNPTRAKSIIKRRKNATAKRQKAGDIKIGILKDINSIFIGEAKKFLKIDHMYNSSGLNKDDLYDRIIILIGFCKKHKINGWRNQKFWNFMVECKPYVKSLIQSTNNNRQLFGKFIKNELRRKKNYVLEKSG